MSRCGWGLFGPWCKDLPREELRVAGVLFEHRETFCALHANAVARNLRAVGYTIERVDLFTGEVATEYAIPQTEAP